jgi:hypothetical protein
VEAGKGSLYCAAMRSVARASRNATHSASDRFSTRYWTASSFQARFAQIVFTRMATEGETVARPAFRTPIL